MEDLILDCAGTPNRITKCGFCGKETIANSKCSGVEYLEGAKDLNPILFYFCSGEHAKAWGDKK